MAEFIAVILITILAVISPGADFAIVTKNSYLYGRKKRIIAFCKTALLLNTFQKVQLKPFVFNEGAR